MLDALPDDIMQRIVMVCEFTDDCTYFSTESYPIMYSSTEAALLDFEKLNKEADNEFEFCGIRFYKFDQFENLPEFYTVDEWFACSNTGVSPQVEEV
jgi:hypothetical protein